MARADAEPGQRASLPFWLGLAATALLLAAAAFLPNSVDRALPVVATVTWWQVAKATQGALFEAHAKAGGARESSWRAAGIGAIFFVGFLCLVMPFALFTGLGDVPQVDYGKSAVIYDEGATEHDARRVGDELEATLRASEAGMEVRLRRKPGLVVSFVVGEGRWDDADTTAAFETLRKELTATLHEPVAIELTNDWLQIKKTLGP